MALINRGEKILCLSPHPDDIEFGAGGTLHKYSDICEILLVVFSDRSKTRNEKYNLKSQRLAVGEIGFNADCVRFINQLDVGMELLPIRFFGTEENRDTIRLVVQKIVKNFDPDLIFTPSINETNQDHQAVGEEVVRVIRGRAKILGYEVPKHHQFFQPNVYVKLSEADIEAKIRALNHFSEFTNRYYFEADVIKSLSRMRALDAGFFGLCEGFELYRLID